MKKMDSDDKEMSFVPSSHQHTSMPVSSDELGTMKKEIPSGGAMKGVSGQTRMTKGLGRNLAKKGNAELKEKLTKKAY